MAMISIRSLTTDDITHIQNWPVYPPEFKYLDYAVRDHGWLAEYQGKPDTWIYITEQAEEIIAFSILSKTTETDAEFRIALRSDKIGQGLGATITSITLTTGFTETGSGLCRIHLIVRKNNLRAIRLYRRLGFHEHGECWKNINGILTHFLAMEISRESYLNNTKTQV